MLHPEPHGPLPAVERHRGRGGVGIAGGQRSAARGRHRCRPGGVPSGGTRPGSRSLGPPPGLPPPPARPRPAAPSRDGPAELTVGLGGRRGRIYRAAPAASRRRSCPAPTCGGGCLGAVGRAGGAGATAVAATATATATAVATVVALRSAPLLPSLPACLPSRMSPEYFLRSLLLIILATFSANASNWL